MTTEAPSTIEHEVLGRVEWRTWLTLTPGDHKRESGGEYASIFIIVIIITYMCTCFFV